MLTSKGVFGLLIDCDCMCDRCNALRRDERYDDLAGKAILIDSGQRTQRTVESADYYLDVLACWRHSDYRLFDKLFRHLFFLRRGRFVLPLCLLLISIAVVCLVGVLANPLTR